MKGVDWDKARQVMAASVGQRLTIEERKLQFKKARVYDVTLADFENGLVRDIIRRLNKEAREEGNFDQQFFNFTRTLESGEKQQYYEEFAEATAKELAQLATKEFKKANRQMAKFFEVHDRAFERFGREYTDLLPFAVPKRRPRATTR